jgi:molybdopterin-biosynthesis enzyme MoeA-like protein
MQTMLDALEGQLEGGKPMLSQAVGAWTHESAVADLLRETEKAWDGLAVGSYPFWREGRAGANFVMRHEDAAVLARAVADLRERLAVQGIATQDGEL